MKNVVKVFHGKLVELTVLGFGLVEGTWGILQLCGVIASGHPRYPVTGSFYNPGPYGCLIGVILPVAVYAMLTSRRRIEKLLPLVCVMMAALLLPGGMSRTGWGGAIAGTAVVVAGLFGGRLRRLPRRKLALIAGAVGLGVLALAIGAYCLKPDSANGRLLMWKIGCRAISLRGVGWENVAGAYGDAQEAYFTSGAIWLREVMVAGSPAYVFNEYIQIAIAFGWPAAVAFVAVVAGSAALYWRAGEYGNCGVVVALAVICMASYPFQFMEFKVLTTIVCAGALMLIRRRAVRYTAVDLWLAAAGLFIGFTGEVDVETEFNKAKQEQRLRRYEDSNRRLLRLLPKTSDPMLLNMIGKNYQAMNRPDSAEHYFRRAAKRVPNRLYPHYLLMKLYEERGDTVKMRGEARTVAFDEPKVPSKAVDQMKEEAKELLERTRPRGKRDKLEFR